MAGGQRITLRISGALAIGACACLAPSASASLPDYEQARDWARTIVPQMTLDEKVAVMGGIVAEGGILGSAAAGVEAIPRLGVPAIYFTDGPNGVGSSNTGTTAFPAAISIAASWDPDLAKRYGAALAVEAKGKGRNYIAAPSVNVVRSPLWGRVPETFGEDPFLSGVLGASETRGMQEKRVIAQIKHYVLNDQEYGRFGRPVLQPGTDSVIGSQPLLETYLEPFRIAIQRGGAASVMCSYNRLNGLQACQNPELLGALRSPLGFKGFIGNDAILAVRDIVAAANAGLDNLSLGALGAPPPTLKAAVENGTLPIAKVDAAVENVLTAMRAVRVKTPGPVKENVSTKAHRRLATEIGADGAVLLRNRRQALPLSGGERVAVIGYDAGAGTQTQELGSPYVIGRPPITPLRAISDVAGEKRVTYSQGTLGVVALPAPPASSLSPASGTGEGLTGEYFSSRDFSGTPFTTRVDPEIDISSTAELEGAGSIRWTGSFTPQTTGPHRFSLALGGRAHLYVNGELVAQGTTETYDLFRTPRSPKSTYHAVVDLTAGEPASIRLDYTTDSVVPAPPAFAPTIRLGGSPPDDLITDAAKAARKADAAVVFASDVSGETMDRTSPSLPGDQNALISAVAKANPRTVVVLHTASSVLTPWRNQVAGIVEAWYPGQQTGRSIAKVLFGQTNPSGRLPLTFPRLAGQGLLTAAIPEDGNVADHAEGNLIGYRYYDANGQKPAYPFGFGLSYTGYSLAKAAVAEDEHRYTVSVAVTNTGERAGTQTVQVYARFPTSADQPVRQLKGFDQVFLRPGETANAKIKVRRDDLRIYDPATGDYASPEGRFVLEVATSARDIRRRLSVRP